MNHGWSYCPHCGEKIAFTAPICPKCGRDTPRSAAGETKSDKSYGVAVILCGIFGIVGLHHFYIGNVVHGIFDLGLFLATLFFLVAGATPGYEPLFLVAGLCFFVDVLHTIIVFTRLIIGRQRDGAGRLVAVP